MAVADTVRIKSRDALAAGYRLHWYEIVGVLGAGSFGITYAANDRNLDHPVAIKELFPPSLCVRDTDTGQVRPSSEQHREDLKWGCRRFLNEAKTLVRFNHPNVVKVLSSFELNDTAYTVMSLESGQPLDRAVADGLIRGEADLMKVAANLLDGVEYMHAAGFIHRDIKPANVLLRTDLSPVLVDFGASHAIRGNAKREMEVEGRGGFAPVEHSGGGQHRRQGPWSDIYSLAAVFYSAMTGEMPAEASRRDEELRTRGVDPLRPASLAGGDHYSPELLAAIERGLSLHADERPSNVAAWRQMFPSPVREQSGGPARRVDDAAGKAEPATSRPGNAGESREPASAATRAEIAALKILIVDDEQFVVNLIVRVLERLGVRSVTSVNSAEQAFRSLDDLGRSAETRVDVIFCDLKMPDIDGLEFIRRLGGRVDHPSIVLMSGVEQKILQTAGGLAGEHGLTILGTLRKPVKPRPLEDLLVSHCELAKRGDRRGGNYQPLSAEEVADGLNQGALEMYFQPKVDVATMRVTGAEALARWRHRDRGVLGPGMFVPIAEESGLIELLTKSVICASLSACRQLGSEGLEVGISINVCAENLEDLSFPQFVVDETIAAGVSPGNITLEITESRVARDALSAMEVLTRLRLKDITLSIDDFGTGFASLEQLKKLPFTELKIDRGFVNGAGRDDETRAILESSVKLARDLRLHIVAEGVETQEDWDLVASLGCHTVQGFFVARPMPAAELPGWTRQWERNY